MKKQININTGQGYWFSKLGLWGSLPIEIYEFGPEHHRNMWHVFDNVSEYQLGDFMEFLQDRPHAYKGEGDAGDCQYVCVVCLALANEFNERPN